MQATEQPSTRARLPGASRASCSRSSKTSLHRPNTCPLCCSLPSLHVSRAVASLQEQASAAEPIPLVHVDFRWGWGRWGEGCGL